MQARNCVLLAAVVLTSIIASPLITNVAGSADYDQGVDPDYYVGVCSWNGGGDGGPATSAELCEPMAVAIRGNETFIADAGNNAVKEWVAASRTVVTLADGGWNSPYGVAVDVAGNVYVADTFNGAV